MWDPNYKRPNPRTKYCGVYAIIHEPSGHLYIGGSTDMTGRWTHHRFMLRRGKHKTARLQALWSLHGEDQFKFVVLEPCAPSVLVAKEDAWLASHPQALNTVLCAHTGRGSRPSANRKAAAVKRWQDPAYREKQRLARL